MRDVWESTESNIDYDQDEEGKRGGKSEFEGGKRKKRKRRGRVDFVAEGMVVECGGVGVVELAIDEDRRWPSGAANLACEMCRRYGRGEGDDVCECLRSAADVSSRCVLANEFSEKVLFFTFARDV